MTIEQVIPYASLALAVAGVVYGYVKNKSAKEIAAGVQTAVGNVVALQATVSAQIEALKKPLEAAVKQLPKTRSKRASSVEVEVNDEPPSAA